MTSICTGDPHARNANAMAVTSFTADLGPVHTARPVPRTQKPNEALALSHLALYIYIHGCIYISSTGRRDQNDKFKSRIGFCFRNVPLIFIFSVLASAVTNSGPHPLSKQRQVSQLG